MSSSALLGNVTVCSQAMYCTQQSGLWAKVSFMLTIVMVGKPALCISLQASAAHCVCNDGAPATSRMTALVTPPDCAIVATSGTASVPTPPLSVAMPMASTVILI